MEKKIVITLSSVLVLSSLCAFAVPPQKLEKITPDTETKKEVVSTMDKMTIYYPNANIKSAIAKYKKGNYSGCLQELFSLTKKDPSNAVAYYYMAMAFTHVDKQPEAIEAYEKVIALQPNSYLVEYATKGRDCLTGGPACKPPEEKAEEQDELDKFINAPYGNGFSNEVNMQIKEKQLNNIQETINKKDNLDTKDIQKIKDFDSKAKSKSSAISDDRIAQVSDEEILNAVKTLKEAGLNLTVQPENYNLYQNMYTDPQMMEISMLLGNNNYGNNNNMMNMLPMLMSQAQKGKNVDPRLMQAMMMNSLMPNFDFNSNNNNRY